MHANRLMVFLLVLECAELVLAFVGGLVVRDLFWQDAPLGWMSALQAVIVALVTLFCFYSNDLYSDKEVPSNAVLFRRFTVSMSIATVVLTVFFFLVPSIAVGRVVFVVTLVVFGLFFFLGRLTLVRWLSQRWLRKRFIIMGTGEFAREMGRLILDKEAMGYHLEGFLSKQPERVGEPFLSPGIIGTYQGVGQLVRDRGIDEVIVAISNRRGNMPMEALLELKFRGVSITDGVTFYEKEHNRVYVRQLNPSWLIFDGSFRISPLTRNAKRALDIALSLIGLTFGAPLMLLAALAVKITSPGAVIYSQIRAGRFGKPFRIYKFRSMTTGAEKGTPQFAEKNDPRVTSVGGFMRKTRIDELPQLYNILRGDMSLVGPRPERPYFIEQLREKIPFYHHRLQVKPGLTGLAQVSYGYSGSDEEDHLQKLQYDLSYIKNLSVAQDLAIVAKTVKVVLIGKGAR